ncbi:hypothetical protein [Candidatus Manganitrophus noduliformans]|uniref:Uncharacterized protein n=1 Tax=Candidatus Manganitrophus noduliformans TaxID=2606439 RepID=A0A7X6DN98_9BACT|nr:hypothetical protein [Candidatus Manganitrophus noduliformans]NKE70038.1 hypothetical protein [Candidatus Manganitrophus noduliformans]
MSDSNKGKWSGDILIAQLLLGILIYVVFSLYPTQPKIALIIVYVLLLGIFFFSWRGLKKLWK